MVVNEFVEAWLFEILRAVGRFFLHPAVYVFLISSIFVGYLRILRERKDFSFKVYDIWFELRTSLFSGVGYGFVVSIITVGAGLVMSQASIWMILIWTLVFGLAAQYRYLSPAYTFGVAIVAALLSSKLPISFLQLGEGEGYDLIGEKTFGKGTVQQAVPFKDGSNIKLTMFKWLTPDGNWIHKKGIAPTVEVKQPDYYHATPIQIEKTLSYNSNDVQVKHAQEMLKSLGYVPGREDGYFSKETESALKAFQNANEMEATGQLDKKTAEVIQTKIIEKIRSGENDLQLQTALKLIAK